MANEPPSPQTGRLAPVVVINLARATERRERIAAHLNELGLPFRLFEAIDGIEQAPALKRRMDPRPFKTEYGRAFTQGEVGCAASFQEVLRDIAAGAHDFVCVLEDDALLAPDCRLLLDLDWLRTLPAFDVLRFMENNFRPPEVAVAERGRFRIVAPFRSDYSMVAQVFSRAGAAKVAAALSPMKLTVDVLVYRDPGLRLRILETRPGAAKPNGMPSTIGVEQYRRDRRARRPARRVAERIALLAYRKLDACVAFCAAWGAPAALRLRRPRS